jgi:hypothetical protein
MESEEDFEEDDDDDDFIEHNRSTRNRSSRNSISKACSPLTTEKDEIRRSKRGRSD